MEAITLLVDILESAKLGRRFLKAKPVRKMLVRLGSGLAENARCLHDVPYISEKCSKSLIHDLYIFGDNFFVGATGMSEELLQCRYRRCCQAFNVVYKISKKNQRVLAGYFVLLPLTRTGSDAIWKGHIEAGRHIRCTDIATSFSSYDALYISAVYGQGWFAQLATSGFLLAEIEKQKRLKRDLQYVFVRPTTIEAQNSFRRQTDINVEDGDIIQKIDIRALKQS